MLAHIFPEAPRPQRVLFRVDAGRVPGLSFGHLERCAVLSRRLRRDWGCHTTLLMRPLPEGLARARELGEATALPPEWPGLLAAAQALVVDLPYPPETPVLDAARAVGAWLVFLDDTGRELPPCQVVLNSALTARPEQYPRAARTLLGPDFLLLDERFAAARHPGPRRSDRPLVLVTCGGSDPTGLTLRLLEALVAAQPLPPCRLRVVLGPGFGPGEGVARVLARLAEPSELLLAPPDLLPLFLECDLAVSAGGRTLYELHALGVPTLAVASAPHEAEQVAAFLQRGLLQGGLVAWDPTAFAQAFTAALGGAAA